MAKYLRYQYLVTQVNPSATVHLSNSNEQQLILTKFYVDGASSVGNQTSKVQLNLPKQTIATMTCKGKAKGAIPQLGRRRGAQLPSLGR